MIWFTPYFWNGASAVLNGITRAYIYLTANWS